MQATTNSLQIGFHALSDPGLLRDNNEDAASYDTGTRVAILADGMGGYNAGEVAANLAVSVIKTVLPRWLTEVGKRSTLIELKRAMEISVDDANRTVYNAARSNVQYAGMGTTLVMAVFHEDRIVVGHVGDSRCYLFRAGQLIQLTRDHSLLQEQLDAGLITPAEAAVSQQKNLVTRAMGVEDRVILEVRDYHVQPGDLYLLCSDGLTDMVVDEHIAQLLAQSEPMEILAKRLVDTANAFGGRDNITVLLAQVHDGVSKPGLVQRWLGAT